MRFALPLLAAVALVALVACAGDDEETTAPLPLAQRFVTADDAPGSKPDPVEQRRTTADFDEFLVTLRELAVDPDQEEVTTVFQDAGFERAGVDARFFGETHAETATHVFSSFIELESDDGATSALDWLETDGKKPCPMTCAVEISDFDVEGIADARGIHRVATADAIERLGNANERPFDSYWIGFSDGSFTYTMDLRGLPGSVSEEQAQEIANAYYDRLTSS